MEPELLEAGELPVTVDVPDGAGGRVRLGLATCYDLRFPELFRRLTDDGATMFVVPAAWPTARIEHWRVLGRARAIENQAVLVGCNTAGTHGGTLVGGGSQVVDARGVALAEAETDEQVLVAEVHLEDAAAARAEFPALVDRRL